MYQSKRKIILALTLAAGMILLAGCGQNATGQQAQQAQATGQQAQEQQMQQPQVIVQGVYAQDPGSEYMVGAIAWQLSAEANALMEQAFSVASQNVKQMMEQCQDPDNTDWEYDTETNAMYYRGERVAVITDIDDTLVSNAAYFSDAVINSADSNNVAFGRFVMSENCVACPGAVEFINLCAENGIEVYYITNRSDQGYRIGRGDSVGSYQQAVGNGRGAYVYEGQEIGASIYQCLGKSFCDITLESMERLGFPIDDQHLILNDSYLLGSSKEAARQAIIQGAEAYPTGQREGDNATGSALTIKIEPHHVSMMLGDNLGDFTDAFTEDGLDAVSRADLAAEYAEEFGTKWIVLPNAMYGNSMSYAQAYGLTELLEDNAD